MPDTTNLSRDGLIWKIAESIAYSEKMVTAIPCTNIGGDRAYQIKLFDDIRKALDGDFRPPAT